MKRYLKKATFKSLLLKEWYGRWIRSWTIISGFLALIWLILRSGTKPNRLTYPCQQAALSTATMAFGIPFGAILFDIKRRVLATSRSAGVYLALCFGFVFAFSFGVFFFQIGCETDNDDHYNGPVLEPPPGYQAEVYHVTTCEADPVNERFAGLDRLLQSLGRAGHKFYDSTTTSAVSGAAGIIAPDDVVIIKINYQWPARGGTNTDLLRGLIWNVVTHPDFFSGEVVVCENTQSVSSGNFDRARNNAADQHQSPLDVVTDFQNLGYSISLSDWRQFRRTEVEEYSQGDMADGYVVYSENQEINGRESYPKFQSDRGTFISLRDGIWDDVTGSYDRAHLKFINVPVLKSHMVYGTTSCVKHYMGVVTDSLNTNSHNAIQFGGLGAVMAEIQLADLNILDAIWVGAIPDHHPSFGYNESTRQDMLLAGFDPVALDYWAVKNILLPAFAENGYPGPYPTADPDDQNSIFREYLDNSMSQILAAGYKVTNNPEKIDDFGWLNGDFQGDDLVDQDDYNLFSTCFTGPDGGPVDYNCLAADFDCDYDVDCEDWEQFKNAWTGATAIPEFDLCD
ncbi:DUF362 domain-containing protein [candidate division CSSED10-310 bacterium]|uniref:DUF362 domain-containing protein n=1 Tax=candidate division CSSED10-310 bacterium TaxID=2855610 RepID=A0ABV6YY95_UNCC1